MTMKSFSWDSYLERISVNPEHVTNNSWRVALLDRSVNVAAKLFHTAYYVSMNVQHGRYAVSWDEITALNLGTRVSSAYFWNHSDRLREQMIDAGARLLRSNNENQYIRTIAFYSGVAVVKVIHQIAEELQRDGTTLTDYALQYHSQKEVKDNLRRHVDSVRGILQGFQNEDERTAVVEDIVETLFQLINLYRERLSNFTVEDLIEVCRLPIPRPSAAKIAELFGQVTREHIKVGIDVEGNGVFKFPVSMPALSSDYAADGLLYDDLWIKFVREQNGQRSESWITYSREDRRPVWQIANACGNSINGDYVEVPLADVKEISRIPVKDGLQCKEAVLDIRPRACDGRYILLVRHGEEESIYLPGRKVDVNDLCRLIRTSTLAKIDVKVRLEGGEFVEVHPEHNGRIPLNAENPESLVIDGDEYPIVDAVANDWLDNDSRFRYLYRAGRRAYQADVCPAIVERFPAADTITYTVDGETICLRSATNGRWSRWSTVPPRFLWRRGTLEMKEGLFPLRSAQVIFVNVDYGDFDEPSQADEELDPATVDYQNRNGEWIAPNTQYAHGDEFVEFSAEGFTLRRPVDRIGVTFKTLIGSGITVLPESEDNAEELQLAKDDILNLPCKVSVPVSADAYYRVILTMGNEHVELKKIAQENLLKNGRTSFHWRDYIGKFSEESRNSGCFGICIRNEYDDDELIIYKFRAANPAAITYNINQCSRHTVWSRILDDGTLRVIHLTARLSHSYAAR